MKTNELMEECRKKFITDKTQQRVNLEVGYIDRAYMIGYNEACEKVLEWLREEFNDIFTTKSEWFDINSDEFLDKFQQSLHPYSVEQIDNCVNMK